MTTQTHTPRSPGSFHNRYEVHKLFPNSNRTYCGLRIDHDSANLTEAGAAPTCPRCLRAMGMA